MRARYPYTKPINPWGLIILLVLIGIGLLVAWGVEKLVSWGHS